MLKLISVLISVFLFIPSSFAADAAKVTPLSMSTTAFLHEGALPVLYTCDGKDVSPQLDWTNIPKNTKSFALIVQDESSKKEHYHWVLYNIPAKSTRLDQGVTKLPQGTKVAKNSMNNKKYNGPCPAKGTAHSYAFKLYALDNQLSVSADAKMDDIMKAMKGHIVGETQLTTVYSRWFS